MAVPVATIDNRTLRVNEWGQLKPWLTYLDADGNPALLYQFRDDGTGRVVRRVDEEKARRRQLLLRNRVEVRDEPERGRSLLRWRRWSRS